MAEPFKGVINVDIRDSIPDWAPFETPKAPDGAPNVVYIVLDDVGFSAMCCYGGPIPTPNIDKIAADGVRYAQWHTTALCSPTRSCLLTGRNHSRNSMACITEGAIGFPNGSGTIPPENGMLSEILGELGWNTYMVGKWHLCPTHEMNLAAPRRNWPSGRGFERWYGFLGAETNQWYPELVYDNHPVDQPKSPEEGYHFTEDITDKALEFIRDAKAIAPEKPFFLYYAPGACHAPHHAPKEWIEKFKGRFDAGYEAMRKETLARQKEMGLVPPDTELPPVNPIGTPATRKGPKGQPFPQFDDTKPWDTLSDGEKRLFSRMAEVYAGFLAHTDHHIGRLLDHLEETGLRENTLVILVSDNGASGEGGPVGSVNECLFFNGMPDDLETNLAMLDELGGIKTYGHYPNGWAMAFNTPFKMWKRYDFNGGTADPCIISWPAGMKARGEIREQYHHAIDIVPTILDCLGVEAPADDQGARAEPLRRRQHALQLRRRSARRGRARRSSTRCSASAASGTRAGRPSPPIRRSAAGASSTPTSGSSTTPTSTAPSCTTSPPRCPTRCASSSTSGSPRPAETAPSRSTTASCSRSRSRSGRSSRRRARSTSTTRTAPRSPRSSPSTSATAPTPSARSSTSRRRVREGVLFAHGARFGGHALYVKDDRLHYVNSFVGLMEQKIDATEDVPTGEDLILAASFEKDGEDPPGVATGILSLYYGDKKVGEGRIKTQPGEFALAGKGSASDATAAPPSPTTTPASPPTASREASSSR